MCWFSKSSLCVTIRLIPSFIVSSENISPVIEQSFFSPWLKSCRAKLYDRQSKLIQLKIQLPVLQSLGSPFRNEDLIESFPLAITDSSEEVFILIFPSKSIKYEISKQCVYNFHNSKFKLMFLFNHKLAFLYQVLKWNLEPFGGKVDNETNDCDPCLKNLIFHNSRYFLLHSLMFV